MTRSELEKLKERLKKGSILDGIEVDARPETREGFSISPVVIDSTHIGWEYVEVVS